MLDNANPSCKGASLTFLTWMSFGIACYGSIVTHHSLAYVCFQTIAALALLRSFCLIHELSHGNVFKSQVVNDAIGVITGLVCILPYYSWKKVHVEHHTWVGWRHKDPTEDDIDFDHLSPIERWIASIAWKFSLPLIIFSFSIRTFFNYSKLSQICPKKRDRILLGLNIFFVVGIHSIIIFHQGTSYLQIFIPALILYLILLEPIAISQHAGISQGPPFQQGSVKPLTAIEQEKLALTLEFPHWFSQHILLGFNYHSLHHLKPKVPGPALSRISHVPTHRENGWKWVIQSKRKPFSEVIKPSVSVEAK